jgi:hypothetical protein
LIARKSARSAPPIGVSTKRAVRSTQAGFIAGRPRRYDQFR